MASALVRNQQAHVGSAMRSADLKSVREGLLLLLLSMLHLEREQSTVTEWLGCFSEQRFCMDWGDKQTAPEQTCYRASTGAALISSNLTGTAGPIRDWGLYFMPQSGKIHACLGRAFCGSDFQIAGPSDCSQSRAATLSYKITD